MNKVVLVGRLTRDPEVRYSQGDHATAVAVDRRFKRDGEPTADFIPCVVFGRSAEFAEKYFRHTVAYALAYLFSMKDREDMLTPGEWLGLYKEYKVEDEDGEE